MCYASRARCAVVCSFIYLHADICHDDLYGINSKSVMSDLRHKVKHALYKVCYEHKYEMTTLAGSRGRIKLRGSPSADLRVVRTKSLHCLSIVVE